MNFPVAVGQAIEFTAGEEVVWLIDDHQNLVLRRSDTAVAVLKKTEAQPNLKSISDAIFDRCTGFKQKRTEARVNEMAHGLLICTGRATITGTLIAVGRQLIDLTAAYQLFWGARMDTEKLFEVSLQFGLEQLSPSVIVAHMDDTIIRKVEKKIAGIG